MSTIDGRIDTGKIVRDYFVHGHIESDIARSQGVSRQAVNQALKPFKALIKDPEKVRAYQNNRALIFDAVESEIVGLALDKSKHKKATLGNVAYALDKVYNINRLEQGKATQNINIQSMIQHTQAGISEAMDALRAVQGQLQVSIGSGEGAGEVMHINDINDLRDDLT
jgi:predicted DNA-binding protein YlxM (UPF0122 family)